MNQKKLKITLLPNGEIKMNTVGIKGKKCLDYAKLMEQLADAKITNQELTPEYYETEVYDDNNLYNRE